jgi:hypothetical protein
MSRRGPALLLLAAVSGCGTTTIISGDPAALIVADGRVLGRGHGELGRRGAPGSTVVIARSDDGRQQTQRVSRQFTFTTLVAGLLTDGICLIACWEYPETVHLPAPAAFETLGSATGGDPWLTPPPGWRPRGAPATLPVSGR